MIQLRFFTDEDVYAWIAPALRLRGFDAISTPEANRRGEPDDLQLEWATQEGRTIVTCNGGHFAAMHSDWLTHGRHHPGILVSSQQSIGDLLHRILRLAATIDADAMQDRIEYLSNW